MLIATAESVAVDGFFDSDGFGGVLDADVADGVVGGDDVFGRSADCDETGLLDGAGLGDLATNVLSACADLR